MITRYPLVLAGKSSPFSSTIAIDTPGIGSVPEPGLSEIVSNPGSDEINIPPVSVCHHVSMIGHFSFPIVLKYHFQTLGFIGSPTVPNNLNDERSKEFGISSLNFINILKAVGVV